MTVIDKLRGLVGPRCILTCLGAFALTACGSDDPAPPAVTSGGDTDTGAGDTDAGVDTTPDVVPDADPDADVEPDSEPDVEPDIEPDVPDADPDVDPDASPECGDGNVDDGEECDDGNTEDGDGCAADCTEELADACAPCETDDECGGDSLCVELSDGLFCALSCPEDGCDDGEECGEIVDGEDVIGSVCLPTAGACGECGNGEVDDGETCDDGNLESGDGCDDTCQAEAGCGDGDLDEDEECDDGNVEDGDGCSSLCSEEFCGDGILHEGLGEECDDGNFDNGDGCDDECLNEPFCGDGDLDEGEECDDGNLDNGDGCDDACVLEPFCGDGELDEGEECDDGNVDNGDGCDDACVIEPFCGDGEVDEGEECDDGNTDDFDGCSSVCVVEVFTCPIRSMTGIGEGLLTGDTCLVGDLDEPATCGSTNSGGDYMFDYTAEESGTYTFSTVNDLRGYDTTLYAKSACDGDELACNDDTGGLGSSISLDIGAGAVVTVVVTGFNTSCGFFSLDVTFEPGPVCGDGAVAGDEECDDGNLDNDDGCSSVCALEVCGDSIVNGEEECDDGNDVDGDGCSAACIVEFCGDGETQEALDEQCDDGNDAIGDGCTPECEIELCGDGVTVGIEECDDGNDVDGDGCSAACIDEFCGDGIHHPLLLEDCDDGNDVLGDGCTPLCQQEVCGDGERVGLEGCDDGNLEDGDGCSSDCVAEVCGDGILHEAIGEECDDGNALNGDGCSASCLIQCFDDAIEYLSGATVATGDTTVLPDNHAPSCVDTPGAGDAAFYWRPTHSGSWTFDTEGSAFNTVLMIRDGDDQLCTGTEIACNDSSFPVLTSSVTLDLSIADELMIVVDGATPTDFGAFVLNITAPPVPPTETVPSPSADDPQDFGPRSAPFVEGDYIEFTWTTAYPSISGLEITAGIDPNFLTCDTQDFDVFINGTDIGDMPIAGGSSSQDFDFTFDAIDGPVYTIRYEVNRSVPPACGAAGFDYAGSSATLVP